MIPLPNRKRLDAPNDVCGSAGASANALVEFIPATGRGSSGKTDSNGAYTLMYDQSTKGAAVGDHTVKIMGRTEAGTPEPVPAKYNDRSELKATVKAGENTFDFSLKSK